MANFTGTSGSDTLTGTASADSFDISQGGNDTVDGLGSNDVIAAGAAFGAADKINGGTGKDTLELAGDYSTGVTLGSLTVRAVETVVLGVGFDYRLISSDATVAAGEILTVDGRPVGAGHGVYFDGSAETDGDFIFYGSAGNDTFIGGGGSEFFYIGNGGADTIRAGADGNKHNEVIFAGGGFSADDIIDGGKSGWDTIDLEGDYSAGLPLSGSMTKNIESLVVRGDFVYSLAVTSTVGSFEVTADQISGSGRLEFDGSASTKGAFYFRESLGNDVLIGGVHNDTFLSEKGGSDVFVGNGGNDRFDLRATFEATDRIDGGAGYDELEVRYFTAETVVFDALTMKDVERLNISVAWYGFNFTTVDANVAAGQQLEVATPLSYINVTYRFDGSAETDGSFRFIEAHGDDILTGGAQADVFVMNYMGNDVLSGAGGDDVFQVKAGFTAEDRLRGGSGADTVVFSQNTGDGLTLGVNTLQSIETIEFVAGRGYALTTDDGTVQAGARLTVDGQALGAADVLRFNGAAETDGGFALFGGAADDVIRAGGGQDELTGGTGSDKLMGGAAADIVTGGLGGDFLYGEAGHDRFVFADVAASTPTDFDWIRDWNVGDRIDLSDIDADTTQAGNQAFTFIGAADFSGAGQLQVVTPGSQNAIIRADVDGDGNADLLIKQLGDHGLSSGSFVL